MSAHEHSVTRFIRDLEAGRNLSEAQAELFKRYFQRLDTLASRQLGKYDRVEDGEAIAVLTMQIFFDDAEQGKNPKFKNREHLAAHLNCIAKRKAINRVKHETAKKRPQFVDVSQDSEFDPLKIASDPGSELAEKLRVVVDAVESIKDERLRTVASLTLQGLTAREIANVLDLSKKTIERDVGKVKKLLEASVTQA